MEYSTTIRGYLVELDTDPGYSQGVQCDVSKGNFQATLPALQDAGCVTNFDTGVSVDVPSQTIKLIEHWAEQHGY